MKRWSQLKVESVQKYDMNINLNLKNVIEAINARTAQIIEYRVGISGCKTWDIQNVNKKTRKLFLTYGAHNN